MRYDGDLLALPFSQDEVTLLCVDAALVMLTSNANFAQAA